MKQSKKLPARKVDNPHQRGRQLPMWIVRLCLRSNCPRWCWWRRQRQPKIHFTTRQASHPTCFPSALYYVGIIILQTRRHCRTWRERERGQDRGHMIHGNIRRQWREYRAFIRGKHRSCVASSLSRSSRYAMHDARADPAQWMPLAEQRIVCRLCLLRIQSNYGLCPLMPGGFFLPPPHPKKKVGCHPDT